MEVISIVCLFQHLAWRTYDYGSLKIQFQKRWGILTLSLLVGGEDDGGRYDIKTYRYDHLQIDIVRGRVDRIYTMSNKIAMPSGIRVGYTMDQVIHILGRKPRDWQGTQSEFSIVTCPVNGEWLQEDYVSLKFNNNKILTSIEYAANRP